MPQTNDITTSGDASHDDHVTEQIDFYIEDALEHEKQ